MSKPNIILTGFMGSGKSAVGRELAQRLGLDFADTDEMIEERAGATIADIFASQGEAAFRALEAQVASELALSEGCVIATGGGMMLNAENAELLGSTGHVFCLTATADEIIRRLQDEDGRRPLLNSPDMRQRIEELLAQRRDDYGRFPQIVTDGLAVSDVVEQVIICMQEQEIINVSHPQGRYNVIAGADLLSTARILSGHHHGPVAVITDSNVGPLYADALDADVIVTMPAGEQNKTLATVAGMYDQLLAAGFDRQGAVVALGGGVVGDVAGFVAATYMRGVRFIQCPTSLLAMVDASVGGKTGVDLPQGKNLVGAFKQPQAVLLDLSTLATLPRAEFAAGMAEVIKAGLIADPELFSTIESRASELTGANGDNVGLLRDIVVAAVEVKRIIGEEDPYELGRRAVLNLGHTFGHAIEQVSGYQIRHGEGVAMGLVAAAKLSADLGFCDPLLEERISAVLQAVGLPVRIPEQLSAREIYQAMFSDKKKKAGQLRFVLLRAVGEVFVTHGVRREEVLSTLRHCGAAP